MFDRNLENIISDSLKSLGIEKKRISFIEKAGYPYKQFNRWIIFSLNKSLLEEEKRESLKESSYDQIIKTNISNTETYDSIKSKEVDLYSLVNERLLINNEIKEILNCKIGKEHIKLDKHDKIRAMRDIASSSKFINKSIIDEPKFIYSLCTLDRYYKYIGNDRAKNWLKYGCISDIATYMTGTFEEFFNQKQLQDFYLNKSNHISTPEEIKDVHSHLIWLEKITSIDIALHNLTHTKDGSERKQEILADNLIKEYNGKGFHIKFFRVKKKNLNLFGKNFSPGNHAIICIDHRNVNHQELEKFIDANYYKHTVHIVLETYPQEYQLDNSNIYNNKFYYSNSVLYPLRIPNIQKNLDTISEAIMIFSNKSKKDITKEIEKRNSLFPEIE